MVEDNADRPQNESPGSGAYITLLARLWADKNGERIRGEVTDVRTGAGLPVDLSPAIAFVKACSGRRKKKLSRSSRAALESTESRHAYTAHEHHRLGLHRLRVAQNVERPFTAATSCTPGRNWVAGRRWRPMLG